MIHQKVHKKVLWLTMDEAFENAQFLLKYCPKYYSQVDYDISELRDGRVFSKNKRIKIARAVNIRDLTSSKRTFVLNAFQMQRNNIQRTNMTDPLILKELPQLSKFSFSNNSLLQWRVILRSLSIKDLALQLSDTSLSKLGERNKKKLSKYLSFRLLDHFFKLRQLKSFSVQIYNQFELETFEFLNKLNALTHFLESLTSLTIFLNHLKVVKVDSFDFKNIFRYVTDLRIHEIIAPILQRILNNISQFENLKSLNIMRTIEIPQDHNIPLTLSLSDNNQKLSKLRELDLSFNLNSPQCLTNFLKSFIVPKSIGSIKISFYEPKWSLFVKNPKEVSTRKANIFTESNLCSDFYKKWEDLKELTTLSLCFTEIEDYPLPSFYFIIPLLAKLINLKSLYYANWHNIEVSKKKTLDFALLWNSIEHLKPTLKKLFIESYAISVRNFSNMTERSNLEELGLCGFILGDDNMKSIFNLFSREQPLSNSSSKLHLELERLLIDNNEVFPRFLESLRYAPRNLEINLHVDVRKLNPESFSHTLCEVVPSLSRKESIVLFFTNIAQIEPPILKRLYSTLCEHQKFKNLIILDRSERELFNNQEALLNKPSKEGFNFFASDDEIFEDEEDYEDFESFSENVDEMESQVSEEDEDPDFDSASFNENLDDIDEDL